MSPCPATTIDDVYGYKLPVVVACRLPKGHRDDHTDGCITWPNGWRRRLAFRVELYRRWWRQRP